MTNLPYMSFLIVLTDIIKTVSADERKLYEIMLGVEMCPIIIRKQAIGLQKNYIICIKPP